MRNVKKLFSSIMVVLMLVVLLIGCSKAAKNDEAAEKTDGKVDFPNKPITMIV
jgi:hypothetical protein